MRPDEQSAFDELVTRLKAARSFAEAELIAKQIYDLGFDRGFEVGDDRRD